MKRLTERVRILAFELQRQRDEANHRQETAERDQEILVLRLQLALKDAGRELPLTPSNTSITGGADAINSDN